MNNFYKFGLASKMRIVILITVVIVVGTLCTIILLNVKDKQINAAMDSIFLSAKYNASNVNAMFNSGLYPFKTYASILSYRARLYDGALIDKVKRLTINIDNVSYGFLYMYGVDYAEITENIRLSDDSLMILIENHSKNIVPNNTDIIKHPSVQSVLQTGKGAIGVPMKISIQGKEVEGNIFAFPLFNAKNEIIGVLGGIFHYENVIKSLFISKNDSYPNEAKLLVAQDGTIITSSYKSQDRIVGLNLRDLNKMYPGLELISDKAMSNEETRMELGDALDSYGAHANVELPLFDDVRWHVITITPTEDVLSLYSKLRTSAFIMVPIAIFIILVVLTLFTKYQITDKLTNLSNLLLNFFKYLNHETNQPPALVKIKSQDELGRMAEAINSNIQRTQKSLEQDSNAVA
ncbi:hypothetical protein LS73_007320, partial [Helicobacter muridarum]